MNAPGIISCKLLCCQCWRFVNSAVVTICVSAREPFCFAKAPASDFKKCQHGVRRHCDKISWSLSVCRYLIHGEEGTGRRGRKGTQKHGRGGIFDERKKLREHEVCFKSKRKINRVEAKGHEGGYGNIGFGTFDAAVNERHGKAKSLLLYSFLGGLRISGSSSLLSLSSAFECHFLHRASFLAFLFVEQVDDGVIACVHAEVHYNGSSFIFVESNSHQVPEVMVCGHCEKDHPVVRVHVLSSKRVLDFDVARVFIDVRMRHESPRDAAAAYVSLFEASEGMIHKVPVED